MAKIPKPRIKRMGRAHARNPVPEDSPS